MCDFQRSVSHLVVVIDEQDGPFIISQAAYALLILLYGPLILRKDITAVKARNEHRS